MPQNKTLPTSKSVQTFLDSIENPIKKADALRLNEIMSRLTGEQPEIWGTTIIGFGQYHYKDKSKREGEWFLVGYSPRKNHTSVYLMCDIRNLNLKGLGKYKKGKGCLYFKRLSDIRIDIFEEIVKKSIELVKKGAK